MRLQLKRASLFLIAALGVVSVVGISVLLASPRARHSIKLAVVKTEVRIARWTGKNPRLASLKGRISIPGVEVEALDSRSGFAGLSDREGNFSLRGVMWYPRAAYDLVVWTGDSEGILLRVTAPAKLPSGDTFDIGELDLKRGKHVRMASLPGVTSRTFEEFDSKNTGYYKELFDKLTSGKESDEDKVTALNDYVASKLNYSETQWELGSPRRVLERGSEYCGHLSTALETLLAVGGYKTRAVHMSDSSDPPETHVVVEVFYGGGWHLYDSTFGLKFKRSDGEVASYKDVSLDPGLISKELFEKFNERVRAQLLVTLPGIYRTGYHHDFYFRGEQWDASKALHSS